MIGDYEPSGESLLRVIGYPEEGSLNNVMDILHREAQSIPRAGTYYFYVRPVSGGGIFLGQTHEVIISYDEMGLQLLDDFVRHFSW